MNEEAFRELLDGNGLVKAGAMRAPPRTAAFTVFSQQPGPIFDIGRLKQQATRFFGAKLGLTVDKKYGQTLPAEDAARVVVATNELFGTRLVFGRRRDDEDLIAAERADDGGGMGLLARRCPTVWLVTFESEDDRVALTIAAILASVFLGPILLGTEIFGVKTARTKLEGRVSPYR